MKVVARMDSFHPFYKNYVVQAQKTELISPERFLGAKVWRVEAWQTYPIRVPRWKRVIVGGDIDPEQCILYTKKEQKGSIPWKWSTDPWPA